jgi:hypothetical protein
MLGASLPIILGVVFFLVGGAVAQPFLFRIRLNFRRAA